MLNVILIQHDKPTTNIFNKKTFLILFILIIVVYLSQQKNIRIMKKINFKSAKEMVCWLMDNEGVILKDYYGRRWLYSDLTFKYSDIGDIYFAEYSIDFLHLYSEGFIYNNK